MELRGLEPKTNVFLFEYDFARDGGELGEHVLEGNPIGMERLLVRGFLEVKTACASAGSATVALSLSGTGDVLAAAAAPAGAPGTIKDLKLDGTAAKAILNKVQGARLVMTIGGAALTAGRFVVALEGIG